MATDSIKIIEDIDDDQKLLRIEGQDDDYYSHCGYDQITFVSKEIELKTFCSEDELSEGMIIDALCLKYGSSLEVIGCPKSNTSEMKFSIHPDESFKWQAQIIMMYEDDFLSPGYTGKRYDWSCSISVPEEFYKKLTHDYRSNRIESLEIGISAETKSKECLWREGSNFLPVNYNGGDLLFLRPNGDEIKPKGYKSASAYATCKWIRYQEPSVVTKTGMEDEDSEELYDDSKEPSEDQNQIIQKELDASFIVIKKYLKIAAYSLVFIAITLLFK